MQIKKEASFAEQLNAIMVLVGWGACIFGIIYFLDHRKEKNPRELGPIYRIDKGDSIYVFDLRFRYAVEKPYEQEEKYDPRR